MNIGTALLRAEMVGGSAGHVERALQVHADDQVEVFLCHFMKEAIASDAGNVGDAVDAPETVDGLGDHGFGVSKRGDIAAVS